MNQASSNSMSFKTGDRVIVTKGPMLGKTGTYNGRYKNMVGIRHKIVLDSGEKMTVSGTFIELIQDSSNNMLSKSIEGELQ